MASVNNPSNGDQSHLSLTRTSSCAPSEGDICKPTCGPRNSNSPGWCGPRSSVVVRSTTRASVSGVIWPTEPTLLSGNLCRGIRVTGADSEYESDSRKIEEYKSDSRKTEEYESDSRKTEEYESDSRKTEEYESDSRKIEEYESDSRKIEEYESDSRKIEESELMVPVGQLDPFGDPGSSARVRKDRHRPGVERRFGLSHELRQGEKAGSDVVGLQVDHYRLAFARECGQHVLNDGGLENVTTSPASMAPYMAITNWGVLGRCMAIVSPGFKPTEPRRAQETRLLVDCRLLNISSVIGSLVCSERSVLDRVATEVGVPEHSSRSYLGNVALLNIIRSVQNVHLRPERKLAVVVSHLQCYNACVQAEGGHFEHFSRRSTLLEHKTWLLPQNSLSVVVSAVESAQHAFDSDLYFSTLQTPSKTLKTNSGRETSGIVTPPNGDFRMFTLFANLLLAR
uniref:Uncharacterized protein n=1 Tax=Timema shepardi TaxID=629360 RepID=A0A7R9B2M6_TIMSH|nr:unnamed protein product [Timema shepardi]